MKEKSSINKILEGRCLGSESEYVGMKKANESHSTATAVEIYDPIADRTVDVLSMGEMNFFWQTRFDDNVDQIKEQIYLQPEIVTQIATELNIMAPVEVLTTDFLVIYKDGSKKAYSIKYSRKEFDKETCKNERLWRKNMRRQMLEKAYWNSFGIEWKIVFSEELNYKRSTNIQAVMKCYDRKSVSTPDQMYRYLIAHKYILVDMEEYIPFAQIAGMYEAEITELYEEVTGHGCEKVYNSGKNSGVFRKALPDPVGKLGNGDAD